MTRRAPDEARCPLPGARRRASRRRRAASLGLAASLAVGALTPRAGAADPGSPPISAEPERAASVIELQPHRRSASIDAADGDGRTGRATLIDLDPHVRAWYVLELAWDGRSAPERFHLENPDPGHQTVRLDPAHPLGVVLASEGGDEHACDLWSATATDGLRAARATSMPYAPLCGERLLLRQGERGRRTAREWAADMLRDHVWGGERITELVRDTLYRDAWRATAPIERDGARERDVRGAPAEPHLDPDDADQRLEPVELGLGVAREPDGRLGMGHWYPVLDVPDVFVSAVTPGAIAAEALAHVAHPVRALDAVESEALVYLVAFDLAHFEVGYAVGTDHPRVGWSGRVRPDQRDPALPGPDGFATLAPLVRTGMLSPAMQGRVAATFTGGFKREHGAMRWGALGQRNHGSHYGFLEEGVILSRLQPGLATIAVHRDGRVDLDTWRTRDERTLEDVRYARQNGVALIEPEADTGRPGPGALVTQWGAGNWSGSADEQLRTLRAGLCLQEHGGRRFLVYGWFSTATPSAMATVFQGYGCRYAMLLDMNALEHTYLALYSRRDGQLRVQHLNEGMNVLDRNEAGVYVPRFVAFPDNRDFFFLLRRSASQ